MDALSARRRSGPLVLAENAVGPARRARKIMVVALALMLIR